MSIPPAIMSVVFADFMDTGKIGWSLRSRIQNVRFDAVRTQQSCCQLAPGTSFASDFEPAVLRASLLLRWVWTLGGKRG